MRGRREIIEETRPQKIIFLIKKKYQHDMLIKKKPYICTFIIEQQL